MSSRMKRILTIKYTIFGYSHGLSVQQNMYRPGPPIWDSHCTFAFIKKSTIFTQWLRNSVKINLKLKF